jgi:hypothetical protein
MIHRSLLTALVMVPLPLRADTPAKTQEWPFDVIRLRNGAVLRGLILESDESRVRLQCVHRHPGRPTVSFPTVIGRGEIDEIKRLSAEQRVVLQAHLQELERSTPEGEKERMEGLVLQDVPWGGKANGGKRYSSDYFTLTSDAPEEIVRRAALRLEQIYVAYSRYLPPRHKGAAPTAVLLLTDKSEYEQQFAAGKQQFLNLAFYDPEGNRIVCYSDLQQLGQRLLAVKTHHKQLRKDLEAKRAEFAKLYKGRELQRMVEPIDQARQSLDIADRKNDDLFATATRQLFATLYHEAFHAYLGSFVYPPKTGEPPRWLNEGLAQIFETAILDGDELRVGHAEQARLAKAKDAVAKSELVPLAELLRSGPKQFMLTHVGDKQVSDRHYLTSWALAFHLAFERRLLGTEALDRFIQRVSEGADAKVAFEELIKEPLTKFEPEFRKYIMYLQSDGNVVNLPK